MTPVDRLRFGAHALRSTELPTAFGGVVQYQSDYVLRLIEQMGGLIRRALEKMGIGGDEESLEMLSQAVGLALEMDPELAGRLSPQSLTSLLEINNLDDRVLALVAEALETEADLLGSRGDLVESATRRDQAAAVRAMLDPSRAN